MLPWAVGAFPGSLCMGWDGRALQGVVVPLADPDTAPASRPFWMTAVP